MRDHYKQEGLHQNALVKELLVEKTTLQAQYEDMTRRYHVADEAHLNNQEMYGIVVNEAHVAVKAQQVLEPILASIDEERLP